MKLSGIISRASETLWSLFRQGSNRDAAEHHELPPPIERRADWPQLDNYCRDCVIRFITARLAYSFYSVAGYGICGKCGEARLVIDEPLLRYYAGLRLKPTTICTYLPVLRERGAADDPPALRWEDIARAVMALKHPEVSR